MPPTESELASIADTLAGTQAELRPPPARSGGLGARAPSRLGHYVVLDRLGTGAMGVVYGAYDTTLDRKVAIKLLHPRGRIEDRRRMMREAQAMAKLSHPNIVQIYEIGESQGEDDPSLYIVMELVDGTTLSRWLSAHERSRAEILGVFIDAGRGLAAAHAEGLVHRDFKPENVMRRHDGRVLVMDFGLARRGSATHDTNASADAPAETERRAPARLAPLSSASVLSQELTTTGAAMGTPAYMSPEQFSGREADARADQFAFCVSLWEALVGRRPFAGASLPELMCAVTQGELTLPPGRSVPGWLRAVLERGLAVEPDARWPSMHALLEALQRDPTRRRRLVAIAGGVLGATLLGVLGVHAHQVRAREDRAAECDARGRAIEAHWSPEIRRSLEDAAPRSDAAAATWSRLDHQVSAYAREWSERRTQACLAVHDRAAPGPTPLAPVVACLDDRLENFAGLVDGLREVDDLTGWDATAAVVTLPPLSACTNDDQSARRTIPPPSQASAVADLHARLERAVGRRMAGDYDTASVELDALVAQAQRLGWRPLTADVLLEQDDLLRARGKYEAARDAAERSLVEAVASGHDVAAFKAATHLMQLEALDLMQLEQGRRWKLLAEALAERVGLRDTEDYATFLDGYGQLLSAEGSYVEAEAAFTEALELRRREYGPDSIFVSQSLVNLGIIQWHQGEYDEALELLWPALRVREALYGAQHPNIASIHNTIGLVQWNRGDDEAALEAFGRALAIYETFLDPSHVDLAMLHNNIGLVQWSQNQLDAALASLDRAKAIYEAELDDGHPDLGMVYNNIGMVLGDQRRYSLSLASLQRALAIRERALGPMHPSVAQSLTNIGRIQLRRGELDEAHEALTRATSIQQEAIEPQHPDRAHTLVELGVVTRRRGELQRARERLEQGLAIAEAALGPDHVVVARARHHLGALAYEREDLERARTLAERGLRILRERERPAEERADLRMLLGRVLFDLGEREAGREQVRQAAALLRGVDGAAALREEIDAWQRDH